MSNLRLKFKNCLESLEPAATFVYLKLHSLAVSQALKIEPKLHSISSLQNFKLDCYIECLLKDYYN